MHTAFPSRCRKNKISLLADSVLKKTHHFVIKMHYLLWAKVARKKMDKIDNLSATVKETAWKMFVKC